MKIKIAHSPDSDDAFMFYALEQGKVDTGSYQFETALDDIQSLNDKALHTQEYDLSAVSYCAYPFFSEHYALMNAGSSMGDNYGPTLIVANQTDPKEALSKLKSGEIEVAVPGLLTSAYLTLKLFCPNVKGVSFKFDEIGEAVASGKFLVGLLIHEGQITYEREGFNKLINLGEWWFERTGGLPLPLGTNVIKRSLDEQVKKDLSHILCKSIEYALNNRDEALAFASQFGRGLAASETDRFVGMYVNELTLNLGNRGKKGVELFYKEAYQLGFIPKLPMLDFV